MLTYVVVEPAIFAGARFSEDPRYANDLERVLRAIRHNGCVLMDDHDDLLRRILAEVNTIPVKYRQTIYALLEEIVFGVRGKKRVAACAQYESGRYGASDDILPLLVSLLRRCGADAAIVPHMSRDRLVAQGVKPDVIVEPAQYEQSATEQLRVGFTQQISLSRLEASAVDDLFGRTLRFAKWIRVYDKQIGKGGNNIGFRDGLDYMLSRWRLHAHSPIDGAQVDVVTAVARSPHPNASVARQVEIRRENAEHILSVEREVIDPLRRAHPVNIALHVREDPEHDFHARFLETNMIVLKLDPGSDILRRRGGFKRVYVDLAGQHDEDLTAIRNLRSIAYRRDGSWVLAD